MNVVNLQMQTGRPNNRRAAAQFNKRMKLTNRPRAACGVACSPFGEQRGFRSLSVRWANTSSRLHEKR